MRDNAGPGSFDFYTTVKPFTSKNTPPGMVMWTASQLGSPGADLAKIPVRITRRRD